MIHYKFSNTLDADFAKAIRSRVNEYFQDNGIGKNADSVMVLKTIMALSMYLVPYFLFMIFGISNIPLLFGLWILMGLSKAFIGTSVMHDSVHGSYSKNKLVNNLMQFSTTMIGADARIWKIQHNVLHHTYTNIENADDDIQPRFLFRFSPNQPKKWFHRFQHLYISFFYGISTLWWVSLKDFIKLFQYRDKGLIKSGREFNIHFLNMFVRKAFYFTVFLVLPILVLSIPGWLTALMFVTMHFTSGIILSLVFQTAHVMPNVEFIEQEDETIEKNWLVHQLYTTTNYATKNKIVSWFTGCLNHQIEHHLFPNICHIHYPKIAGIVRETSKEFNLPYYEEKTLGSAINSHFRMLRDLGR
jgi:linoleoyl-CoA desaturase